jgi:hypothetical protein
MELSSPLVIALAIPYFCWSTGVYGFVLWLPSNLRSGNQIGIVEVGWLAAVPYLLATLLNACRATSPAGRSR